MQEVEKKNNSEPSYKSEYERLVLPYLRYLFKLAYRMTGNWNDAEDLAQETFRVAYEKFYQLKEKEKCKSWLTVILKNLYFKELKKNRNYTKVDLTKVSPYLASPTDYKAESIRGLVQEELQAVLDELDDKYKIPLVLSYLGDFSYKEISKIMGIPMGTVMSRIARGKQYLKKMLTQ